MPEPNLEQVTRPQSVLAIPPKKYARHIQPGIPRSIIKYLQCAGHLEVAEMVTYSDIQSDQLSVEQKLGPNDVSRVLPFTCHLKRKLGIRKLFLFLFHVGG